MVWKYVYFSIGALFIILLPGFSAAGDAETLPVDEQEYLKLFFEEEELVEVATRSPKPISQIAENVTIITAEEIMAMNAHTVAEVLNRTAGIFVDFAGRDFANRSFIHIHGSDYEHILVLLDGIRWNHPSADSNFTNQIPVQIIKRIEIIKGPASSAWGSALGGVVNIITKDTGKSQTPSGLISGSYGEHNSLDFRAEAAGTAGTLGYYLFAGRQESDGILDNKFFDNDNFYGKIDLHPTENIGLNLTLGYTNPQYKVSHVPQVDYDFKETFNDRVFFYTAVLDLFFSDELSLSISAHRFEDAVKSIVHIISTGEIDGKEKWDAQTKGIRSRLVFNRKQHTVVLGAEYERRDNDDINELINSQPLENSEEIWAIFANDTIRLQKTTITPGIRYDHLSVAQDIFSPSLGITYRLNDTNLFRFLVARGFRKPTLDLLKDNPSLEKDKTWSYQAGFETTAVKYASLKTTFFYHKTDDYWDKKDDVYVNSVPYKRKGVELEIKTHPFYHLSLIANGTYVRLEPGNRADADLYDANLILAYDNPRVIRAILAGHYNWWGTEFSPEEDNGDYGRFIWDLALTKKVFSKQRLDGELFFTARNLFNRPEFTYEVFPSAGRWVEAGLRVCFR